MKKFLLLGVVILMAFSCTLPQYQLKFEITGEEVNSDNDVVISYRLENIGYGDISNVVLQIMVKQQNAHGFQDDLYAFTDGVSLGVGVVETGEKILYIDSGYNYIEGSATVYSVGWDTE